ncbi:hypothetical protein [Burkholderia pseudomultivorans]|uniref:hypothetical protein n=1 Tax=Burkholderia pseudomultivorans TaxID=1207504 RepID=UPI000B29CB92|nr:hypothetical protein [Burkholderia pseudomultivorans]
MDRSIADTTADRPDRPANWRTGELANWRTGELANWRTGELAIWRSGDPAIRRSGDPAIRRPATGDRRPAQANRLDRPTGNRQLTGAI